MYVLPARIYEHQMSDRYIRKSEVDTRSPGTRVMDDCELLCRCWKSNPSPPQKHALLITEPALQPIFFSFLKQGFPI